MEVQNARCAGIDVHKKSITVCVLIREVGRREQKYLREFGTTTRRFFVARTGSGWEQRLILVSNQNTALARGWCLEVHDLAIARYSAGREKDLDCTATLARHGLVRMDVLLGRLTVTRLDDDLRARISAQIERQFSPHGVA